LFADLSDFTAMSERMDPEDVKALAHRCSEQMSAAVRSFGGTVVNVMGDAIVAVFGAPVAHEDDAERAVRAGLAIRDCQLSGSTDPAAVPLRVHVGINTGEVVAGLVGPEERRDYTVMGDTVNTAARLMSAAAAGTVLVGEETYLSTRQRIRYDQVPPVDAKGKDRPVLAWAALEARNLPRERPLGTAPLVGRDDELALLTGIWTKVAREARPHLVTVLGEPGIGKSRLVAELERQVDDLAKGLVLHGRCLPYGQALGYWALAMALKDAAAVSADDDVGMARRKLGDLVTNVLTASGVDRDPDELASHVALVSGLDTDADRSAAVDERTLHASVRRFLEALARRRPLCLVLEDIHWADDALLNLIEAAASRAQDAPLLIVTQARPELLERRPTWGGGVRAFTSLPLGPLDEHAARALVLALCHERGLHHDVAESVGRGASGNPLFAEELVATIAERPEASGIPSAIKALIAARLDALPVEHRRVLQRASVFGKHCWEGGVAALGAHDNVTASLDVLEHRDLLRPQPRSRFRGVHEYAFKHDLIRDVAYEMLPRADRRLLHSRAADWIEQAAGARVEEVLDLLAHHALQAEQDERALGYLVRAANRSHRAAAHREEATLLAQAMAIAEQRGQRELAADLQARRGKAFARLTMWADAKRELEAALVGLAPDQVERRVEVLIDLSQACNWSLDTVGLRRHADEARRLAESPEVGRADLASGATFWLAWADGADGQVPSAVRQYRQALQRAVHERIPLPTFALPLYSTTLYWEGQLAEAVEQSRGAVRVARGANDTDATMMALQSLGLALAGTGRYSEAIEVFDETLRFGREYGIGPFLARGVAVSVGFHLDVFDFVGHERVAEEARELARSLSFPPALASTGIDLLLNYARRGEPGRADGLIDQVSEAAARTGSWHGWQWKVRLGEARAELALARGEWESALTLALAAVAHSRASGRRKYEALGQVTKGRALMALGRGSEAVAAFQEAVRVSRPVGDPALFFRTATALLDADGDDGLAREARDTAERIAASLPDDLRQGFERAEPVRRLAEIRRTRIVLDRPSPLPPP
jgi:class 3 adenylate cyclase/tetratricopeptide (TPR) repeat protein